ncbi:hypothetical protein EDC94DRAFT_580779 [Helicostylum pulchrum]|nr:hypothetical protein EDC94DRAFT_580779 [Helicostylum pulchrum]
MNELNTKATRLSEKITECIIQFDNHWVFVTEYEMDIRNRAHIDDCVCPTELKVHEVILGTKQPCSGINEKRSTKNHTKYKKVQTISQISCEAKMVIQVYEIAGINTFSSIKQNIIDILESLDSITTLFSFAKTYIHSWNKRIHS